MVNFEPCYSVLSCLADFHYPCIPIYQTFKILFQLQQMNPIIPISAATQEEEEAEEEEEQELGVAETYANYYPTKCKSFLYFKV